LKRVTTEIINEVRGRASLYEVIAEHVVLKRSGKDWAGLCPFHKEKSASFTVVSDKGFYKCFGCGESGDVFSFLQKFKGLDFLDAVRELAEKYGVQLIETEEDRQEYDKRSALLMLYQQASEYFSHLLLDPIEGQVARDYLHERGITDDIITRFKLGYAANSWDGLSRYLMANTKVTAQTLDEAGLAKLRPESNGCYDLFRHRLMIPISDEQGRVIAFGGRTLGDDQIKYLNSPETPLYSKSHQLYGFFQAKESIKKEDSVIVVEGYFDVITSHLYGFSNTVAISGTTLSEHQAKMLVKYTESKRIYLALDADAAGVQAVNRAVVPLMQIAEGIGLDLRVIKIPGGKDPDECLRTTDGDEHIGPTMFSKAIHEAPSFVEYQLHKAVEGLNLSSHTGKIDAAKNLVPVFAQMKNAVARGEYVRQWAMKLGIQEENLLSDVRQYRNNHRPVAQPEYGSNKNRTQVAKTPSPSRHLISSRGMLMSGYVNAEQHLLALYLTSRDDYDRVFRHLDDEEFISTPHQRIKDAISGVGSNFHTIEDLQAQLMDRLSPDSEALSAFVEVLLKVDMLRKQNLPVEKIIQEFRVVLLKERITRALYVLRSLLATAETDIDLGSVQNRIIQLNNIEKVSLINPELSLEEIAILKRKIDEIGASENPKSPEMSA
jgi:DNA primase